MRAIVVYELGGLKNELRFCMDWDIYLRISEKYPVVVVNDFLAVSREYEDTKTRTGTHAPHARQAKPKKKTQVVQTTKNAPAAAASGFPVNAPQNRSRN